MDIIVTGAAGFIGSNLTQSLLEKGHKVIGIDNLSYGNLRNIKKFGKDKNFQFVKADLKENSTLEGYDAEIIVHLASQKIPRYSSALLTLNENSVLLKNVLGKCIREGCKLVFASTSDIYGKNPDLPYSELSNMVLGPTTVKRWAYAISKIYAEQLIIANNAEFSLQYTIMRFFGSYGPNQNLTWWGGPQSVFIDKALKNEPMDIHGDGLQTRTFTFISDTVQGIEKCMFHPASTNEIFNIAANPDEETTIADLGDKIWKMINGNDSEPKINFIPYNSFGNYEDVHRRVPDISKIKSSLGFKPEFSLTDGLAATIEWQRKLEVKQ
ncbi:MAG: NAD-dependent epimerase/dehydratase family protein [Ignavibacteria bacterium]|nr:NAD-dependent epimerase/dehydratase family protein [Ignavibacteria bacterium]